MIDKGTFSSYQPIRNNYGRNDRYAYAIIELQEGQKMFLKTSSSPSGIGDLRRELVWNDFMAFVEDHYPSAELRSPHDSRLLEENSLVMEYIDAPVVAQPGDGSAWKANIDRYIDTLIVLDQAAGQYATPDSLRGYQTRSLTEALTRWLRYAEIDSQIEQGYDFVKRYEPRLDYRVQHGDFMPWQIFDADQHWVVFDGERAGDDLPRYNDLAYSYGRLAIKCGDTGTADYMLSQFIKRQTVSESDFWEDYLPVAVFRLLGMVGDAIKDGSEGDRLAAMSLLTSHLDRSIIERIDQLCR